MSSQTPVEVPSLGTTLGALYIGATIATMQVGFVSAYIFANHHNSLFGITNTQAAKYYKKYPGDWWIFRYSVGILWTLDALHVALTTHLLYHYLIDSFGDYDELLKILWYTSVSNFSPESCLLITYHQLQLVTEMLTVVGVQGIYMVRIWKRSCFLRLTTAKPNSSLSIVGRYFHRTLPWIVSLAYLVALGNGIFSVYTVYFVSDFKKLPGVQVSIIIISAIPMFSDFVIALSMCYYLHKSRQASDFSTTSDMLLGMIRLGVISGSATRSTHFLEF
ncbi:hypothetical protein EDD18DRAFT_1345549 [Armillaria luteobubalina]|uniref:Uncharacterized protein n=1 Tax=Armillaria luteobubalina TaxID=153913 RepID=A0AA39QJ03_9AGAR|nr:hypothetical protein EDD18DRAFT_1345549 [Armillaria luteobubalina]